MSMTEDELREYSADPIVRRKKSRESLLAAGVAPEMVDMLLAQLSMLADVAEADTDCGYIAANAVDHFVEAYTPNPENDRADVLRQQMAAPVGKRPRMEIFAMAADRRVERFELDEDETQRHFLGSLAERRAIEARRIIERRSKSAALVAERIEHHGGFRAARVTVREELDLRTFGALTHHRTPRLVAEWRKRIHDRVDSAETHASSGDAARAAMREGYYDDIVPTSYNTGRSRIETAAWGPNAPQVYISDIWDQLAKCAYAAAYDPVAKQSLKIIAGFVNGRGIHIRSTASEFPEHQIVLEEFLERTRFIRRVKKFTFSAARDGELFTHVYPLGDGRSDIRPLEAASIWEVVTLAEDVTRPISYVQRYMTRFQMNAGADNAPRYISREYSADEVVHLKLNVTESEPRGRSDLLCILGLLKYQRDLVTAQINQETTKASYVYSAKVKGSREAMQRVESKLPKVAPPPGSSLVMNENTELTLLSPQSGSNSGAGSINETVLNLIACGMGFSKLYLGADGSRSRAGSAVQSEPSEKSMEDRQDEIGEAVIDILRRMFENAKKGGLLANVPDEKLYAFTVEFPEILKGDTTGYISNLQVGRMNGYVSAETASSLWATQMELPAYSFDTERAKIKDEAEQGIDLPSASPSFGDGGFGGDTGGIGLSDPTSRGLSDPTTSAGKDEIRKTDRASLGPKIVKVDRSKDDALEQIEAAVKLLTSHGAVIIREHA